MLDIQEEIKFWTQIMRDHGEFQYTNLSPKEKEAINTAAHFIKLFEKLHKEICSSSRKLSPKALSNLVNKNKEALTQFINFKRVLLSRLITCDIELGMPPSFLNHMINEALEYYNVLCLFDQTAPFNKVLENIRLHKVWLPDASGHASAIAADLDPIEFNLIHEARDYVNKFDHLFKKAFEMYNMFKRTKLENGLQYFNNEVKITLEDFICFLEKLENISKQCKIYKVGTFSHLMPNHMIREEKYYIYRVNLIEV